MMVFARPVMPAEPAIERRLLRLFVALFLVGAVLRAVICFGTVGRVHPDEHQQYLEQAYRLVYGYGCTFWEQQYGVRHPLYPALLAVPLAGLKELGVTDPFVRAGVLRWLVALLALAACARFAWEFHRRGDSVTALVLMAVTALSSDVAYAQSHPLTEIAASVPFLLALVWLKSRPFVAGWLLGLAFALRFQTAILIACVVPLAWWGNGLRLSGTFARLSAGLALALICMGLGDRLIYGAWFHTPVAYLHANFVDGVADYCGVEPWYQYFLWIGGDRWAGFVFMAALLVGGAWREWRLAVMLVVFVAVHTALSHKEARFLLPVAPLALALMAVGLSRFYHAAAEGMRGALAYAALPALLVLSAVRAGAIEWEQDPFRATALLLGEAGKLPDVTGVAVCGPTFCDCGNYFYLSRDIPLATHWTGEFQALVEEKDWLAGRMNYLICGDDVVARFARWSPRPVMSRYGYTLYRLERESERNSCPETTAVK
jgi:GPI mannosyltransferase 3